VDYGFLCAMVVSERIIIKSTIILWPGSTRRGYRSFHRRRQGFDIFVF
jgi:hypothetical protein